MPDKEIPSQNFTTIHYFPNWKLCTFCSCFSLRYNLTTQVGKRSMVRAHWSPHITPSRHGWNFQKFLNLTWNRQMRKITSVIPFLNFAFCFLSFLSDGFHPLCYFRYHFWRTFKHLSTTYLGRLLSWSLVTWYAAVLLWSNPGWLCILSADCNSFLVHLYLPLHCFGLKRSHRSSR